MAKTLLIVFLVLMSIPVQSIAQSSDSLSKAATGLKMSGQEEVVEEKPHSARKAALLSVFIPGAGQIYNKKWWKVPIVYGGLGASIYAVSYNRDLYHTYRDAYRAETDGDPNTTHEFEGIYNQDYLEAQRNYFRGNMEISYVVLGAVYFLQIIDASVDAHLMSFDVSDNLSMNIHPVSQPFNYQGLTAYNGLSIQINFKNAHSSRRIR